MMKERLEQAIRDIFSEHYPDITLPETTVERPERFADYASNAALATAKELGRDPKELAEELKEKLFATATGKELIEHAEVAGPGFLNITVRDRAICTELERIPEQLTRGLSLLSGVSANVEFVSANPTGALHIGHGRGAFFGDALAAIFAFAGARVTREYYINNSQESNQIKELGKTALGHGEQYLTPELKGLIETLDFSGMDEGDAGFLLASKVQEQNAIFLEDTLGVNFDTWYSEDDNLRASGAAEETLNRLKSHDLVYEHEGAQWLKTSEYGDDEDRVLVRGDGSYTYFLTDIAYHDDKFERGFNRVVDVWGADHHGHIKRMKAVKAMLDWQGEFQIFITQLVGIKEGGEYKKMSKRAGNVILLSDLVEEFGLNVVRWFFLEKAVGTHMEFDVERAKEQSEENPVYYVQYAHARICSIQEKLTKLSADKRTIADVVAEPSGRVLAMKLTAFPETIAQIASDYGVQRMTTYAYELAHALSQCYRDVRVIEENNYHAGAAQMMGYTRDVIAKSLALLGISAPERM